MGKFNFELVMFSLGLYFIVSQVCAFYFWYLWAQSHGFISSLIIGPIVGEFKGLLWPFFI